MFGLYIDTHYIDLVVALLKDGKVIDKREVHSNKHSENTIYLLDCLFKENQLTIEDIQSIIVINGPGSFTGVRIGIVIAKIMGYTKNIEIKALSYLEALALNYDKEVNVGIEDKNGVFVGEFNQEHELKRDYYYLSKQEYEVYDKEIILDDKVDIEVIYQYVFNKESILPHLLKPLYVKRLEVEHD